MEHLNDTLKYLTPEESRILLRQFYTGAYELDEYKTSGAVYVWKYIYEKGFIFDRAIDVGCGSGYGLQMSQLVDKVTFGIDIAKGASKEWHKKKIAHRCAVSDILNMPFKDGTFDFVVCNDVLEHIPEFDTDAALQEIRRIGSDKYFLAIATAEECYPALGMIHAHITVKPDEWWREKVKKNHFDIAIDIHAEGIVSHFCVLAVKDRMPYIKKEKRFMA